MKTTANSVYYNQMVNNRSYPFESGTLRYDPDTDGLSYASQQGEQKNYVNGQWVAPNAAPTPTAAGPGSEFDRMVSMAAKYRAATAAGNKLGAMTPEMQYGAKLLDSGYKAGGDGNANARVLNGLSQQGVNMNSVAAQAAPAGMAQGGMNTGTAGPATPGAGAQVQPRDPNPMGYGADQLNQQQMDLLQKRSAVTAENVNPARPGRGMPQGGMDTSGTGPVRSDYGFGMAPPGEEQQIMLRKQQAGAGPATPAAMDAYYQKDAQDQAERARRIRAAQAANGIAPMDTSGTGPVRSGFGASNELPASSDARPGAARNYSYGRQPPVIADTSGTDPVRSDYGFGMAPPEERPAGSGPKPQGGFGKTPGMGPMVQPPRGGFGATTRPTMTRPEITRPAVTRPRVSRPASNPNPMGYGADQLNPQQMALLKR